MGAETEMRWVDAWTELYDIVGERREAPCQLPDYTVVAVDECLGWLQTSVYEGFHVTVKAGWVGHRKGVVVSRYRPDA